jgi:Flp pilus assembly protein TadG
MYHKRSERGQALVIIALAAVGLVAFTALAIDGGMVLSDRRHAQNAADTAAFAAALAKIRTPNYAPSSPAAQKQAAIDAGLERADSNGYDNNGTTNTVQVNIPPVSGPYVGDDDYIQVIITSKVRMMFARVVGWAVVENKAEAVTRAQSGSSDTASGLAAISALSPSGTGVFMNGNITLDVIGSGVFSNSNSGCPGGSIVAVGNGELFVDTDFSVGTPSGGFCSTPSTDLNGAPVVQAPQIPYPPTNINPPVPSITCSPDPITITGNTINPGTATGQLSIPSSYGAYTFAPGNYCLDAGLSMNGDFDFTANDVNFRIGGSGFTLNGSASLTCNNVLFHSVSGPGVDFLGNSTSNCSNVTFYMSSGTADFSGVAVNTLSAPTSGVYKGLLIYLPYLNSTPLNINGNSLQNYTGSIIGVSSDITVAGNNTSFAVNSQFVGYTFTVSGNINFSVNYDPALQYLPPEGPAIELIE